MSSAPKNPRTELRKQRKEEVWKREQVNKAIRALLWSPDGRQFLWWLLAITHWGQTPFTANALTTSFACGEQNIGQQLIAEMMEVDPEGFLNLIKEMNSDRDDDGSTEGTGPGDDDGDDSD